MKRYQYLNFDILENVQLDGYFYVLVSGQRHTGLETKSSSKSPGTIVHGIHVLFVFFTVFENLRASFSRQNDRTCHICFN